MLVFWYCYVSIFCPNSSIYNPIATYFNLIFLFLYWKYNIVILYMNILSKISYSFKPNQAPNVGSSVGYIISCMPQPLCKVLCSCTGTQNAKNKNASLELISHHLPWTNSQLNFTWLCKQNHDWIYQASVSKTWCWHFFSS